MKNWKSSLKIQGSNFGKPKRSGNSRPASSQAADVTWRWAISSPVCCSPHQARGQAAFLLHIIIRVMICLLYSREIFLCAHIRVKKIFLYAHFLLKREARQRMPSFTHTKKESGHIPKGHVRIFLFHVQITPFIGCCVYNPRLASSSTV